MTYWQWFKQSNVWIPTAFVTFFAVVFLANGIMIWSALNSWRGHTSERPWIKDAAYKGVIDPDSARGGLDWDVGVEVTPDGARRSNVAVTLRTADGAPVRAKRVRVGFVRPGDDGYRDTAYLVPQGDGVYAASVAVAPSGMWKVRIAADKGDDALRRSKQVILDP
jgi:nitrogen fixation protein FixH